MTLGGGVEPPWGTPPEVAGPDDASVPAWGTSPVEDVAPGYPTDSAPVTPPLRRPRRSSAARRWHTTRHRLEVIALTVGGFELAIWATAWEEHPDGGDAVGSALFLHGLSAAGAVAVALWLLARHAWRRVRRRVRSATP